MQHVTYVGRHAAVDIETAPRRWRTVQRGDSIEVSDRLASTLLEQPDNWQPTTTKTKPGKAGSDKES